MAAGDRKVKIQHMNIFRANPVKALAIWTFHIENKLGVDVQVAAGHVEWNLGTPAVARAKTLEDIETEAVAQVTAAQNTPANDSIS
jgi:hypothetical protein